MSSSDYQQTCFHSSSSPSHAMEDEDDEETDWAQFEDAPEHPISALSSSSTVDNSNDIVMIPPQLHPAVSFGMRKVSSSYFSIASHESMMTADLISKLDETNNNNNSPAYDTMEEEQWDSSTRSLPFDNTDEDSSSDDLLYHDILMNVFTFLDAQALAAFSETARRPNFEVFYFLQLQLQRAIVLVENDPQNNTTNSSSFSSSQQHHHDDDDELTAIAGSAFLSRLTRLDPQKAQETVNEYLESNSTLRSMPLSHSIAYMRHFLNRRRGFYNQLTNNNTESNNNNSNTPSPQALASAALLATVVGAAYMSSSSGGGGGGEMMMTMPIPPELPNILFRFGFVGSLMGAAKRQMSDVENYNNNNKSSPPHQFRFPSSLLEMKETLTATLRNNMNTTTTTMMNATTTTTTNHQQKVTERMLSNPYDHHYHHIDEAKDNDGEEEEKEEKEEAKEEEENKEEEEEKVPQKMPSGCVGAYSRAIASATNSIENLVKEGRKNRFAALDEDEQQLVVMTFLDACSSDDGLALLQQMIHTMDVDGFHLASDGSETCALHTAAFNGAAKVLDYLLQGIDDSDDESKDGGLCQVNCRDSNGWTALHFAAGSNSVSAIHVLAKHGADLSMEANNGYSPLQWAKRLSNEQAEEALKELIHNESDRTLGWMSSQPLTTIANRFFALMPSH